MHVTINNDTSVLGQASKHVCSDISYLYKGNDCCPHKERSWVLSKILSRERSLRSNREVMETQS